MIEAFIYLFFLDGEPVTLKYEDVFKTKEECTALVVVDAPNIAVIAGAVGFAYECIAPGVAA